MAAATFTITKKASPDVIARELLEPMTNLGNGIARRAQRVVPKRTWALHDTIDAQTEIVGDSVVTTVGAGDGEVDYALFVEEGTSRMGAQPYLRPAMLQSNSGDFGVVTQPARHGRVSVASTRGASARQARGGGSR